VELLQGAIKVTFQRLIGKESDLINKQLSIDASEDMRQSIARAAMHYQNQAVTYAMVMSICEIEFSQGPHVSIPPIAEREISSNKPLDLAAALQDLQELIELDDVYRMIFAAYIEFDRTCNRIWELIHTPNFTNAIE
jgi:hypothetical protein